MADDTAAQAMANPGAEQRRLLALLILDLLRVRALVEEGNSTTCDICGEVREVTPIECRDVIEVLEQLHTLGLVQNLPHAERADAVPTNTWVAAPAYAAALGHGSDGGHGGYGGNAPKEGPGPPSPRRYPEVLAHPVLFALSQEDFESALAQMLPEGPWQP